MGYQVFPVRLLIGLLFAGLAVAQPPLIYNRSVYNAASFMPSGVPAGAIARGSIFSIFGAQLGPAKPATAGSFPLGTTLAGVSINVVQGSTSVSAIPVFVSAGQINAIMPSKAPLGVASLQVVVNNAHSNMAPIQITSSAVGIFTANGTGIGPGVLYNFVAQNNQPINSTSVTAKPGQVITLWATGLGPISTADNVAPTAGNLPVQVQVFVGGQAASVQYSGRSTCCSGVDQIVFTVPNNAPTGCWVPVYVKTAGTTISNFVTMAIETTPGSCTTDVLPQVTSAFLKGQKLAEALATRTTTRQDVGVLAPVDVTTDFHVDFAFQPDPGQFPFNPALAFPPGGTCTVYGLQGDMLDSHPLPGMAPTTMPLDLGAPFLLTGPLGSRTLSIGFFGARARLSRRIDFEQYSWEFSFPRSWRLHTAGIWRNGCRPLLHVLHRPPAVDLDQSSYYNRCESNPAVNHFLDWRRHRAASCDARLWRGSAHEFERRFRLHGGAGRNQFYGANRYAGESSGQPGESAALQGCHLPDCAGGFQREKHRSQGS